MFHALLAPLLLAAAGAPSDLPPDEAPIACSHCGEWNQEQAPFRIFGNTWYVGVHGLSSVLIVTKAGLIVLDGDLPQSAESIAAHIKAAGYSIHDVRWILNSHVHVDHAGGIAALQRMTGANVGASGPGAQALRVGIVPADDPQAKDDMVSRFPAVQHVEALRDGESITLGDTTVTAHYTPGHTPGGTTWTWQSCQILHCVDVVYADSISAVAFGDYKFGDPARRPPTSEVLRNSIDVIKRLPCDVLISTHPDASGVFEKAAANARDAKKNAFIDRDACRAYAKKYDAMLDDRLQDEAAGNAH